MSVVETHPGTGWCINEYRMEAYGLAHTFGGTLLISDGNFLVSIGKYLTAEGLVRQYPGNTDGNLTADGRIHIYKWDASAGWVEQAEIGNPIAYSTRTSIAKFGSGANENIAVYAESDGNEAVKGVSNTASAIMGTSNAAGIEGGSYADVGGTFWGAKGPIELYPDTSSTPPSHAARKGVLWVTSTGNMFINVSGGSGYGAWKTIGTAYGDLRSYAMADGSMSEVYGTGRWICVSGAWHDN